MLQCPKCPKKLPTECQLQHHMKGHGSDTPLLCDFCGFTTKHHASMNVHKKRHDGKMYNICTVPTEQGSNNNWFPNLLV